MDGDTRLLEQLMPLADSLIPTSSSRSLTSRLEEILTAIGAVPAQIYLHDQTAGVLYPALAFGCAMGEEDIPVAGHDHSRPGWRRLARSDELIGMLAFPPQIEDPRLDLCAVLLGPVLINVHAREASVDERRMLHNRIHHLLAAGQLLRHLDIDHLLVEILNGVMESVEAQVGAVLTGHGPGDMTIRVTLGLQEHHVDHLRMADGMRVVDHVAQCGEILCLDGDDIGQGLDLSALEAHVTGLLVLPLDSGRGVQGVVLLANSASTFDDDRARMAETVCQMASIALENVLLVQAHVEQERLRGELQIARNVQADMFPAAPLQLTTMGAAGAVRSCDETGGDYFGYLERDGRLVAMVGDVTGHGLGAALFTTAAHAIIQQQLSSGQGLPDSVIALNSGLRSTHSGRFMTMALLEIDPQDLRFSLVSAGHNPVLWLHQGAVRWLPSATLPLGIVDQLPLEEVQTDSAAAGDVFVMYTDGFTEAFDGDGACLGEERFAAEVVAALANGTHPRDLIAHLFAFIDRWTGQVQNTDDLTLVVVWIDD